MPFDWEAFWKKKSPSLLVTARRLLRNQEDAEDAVQDAFLSFGVIAERLLQKSDLEEEALEEMVTACFYKAVRWRAADIRREYGRRAKIEEVVQGEEATKGAAVELSADEQLQLEALDKHLRGIAKQLSPRLQKLLLFLLRHVDDDPENHWPLWAAENNLAPESTKERNSYFDQPKRLLRAKLVALGIYHLLGGRN